MNKELFEKAKAWLEEHRDEYLSDLARLIAIPSVADGKSDCKPYGENCRRVLDEMLSISAGYGFATENYDYKVGALIYPGRGDKTVGIWGHLDVVPAGDDWERPPFELTREGDVIYGRGVGDNKGPSLMSLYVLRCMRDMGIELEHTVKVFFGTTEETGMDDVVWYAANCPLPDFNLIPDASFPVYHAEKGILEGTLISNKPLSDLFVDMQGGVVSNMVPPRCSVTLREDARLFQLLSVLQAPYSVDREPGKLLLSAQGVARHSADPYEGVNAIHLITSGLLKSGIARGEDADILSFITRVNADCDGSTLGLVSSDDISGRLTCVGSMVRVKDGCPRLKLNIRYPVTVSGEELVKKIKKAAEEADYTFEVELDSKPNHFPKEHPFTQALMQVYRDITGDTDTEPGCMSGGTYARKLPNAVAFGAAGLACPDNATWGQAHQHDEGVYLPDTMMAGAMYVATLKALENKL